MNIVLLQPGYLGIKINFVCEGSCSEFIFLGNLGGGFLGLVSFFLLVIIKVRET